VRDAGDDRRPFREAQQRGDHRGQLAYLVQIQLSTWERAGAGHREAVSVEFDPLAELGQQAAQPVAGLGGVLGQPATRTVPPAAAAATTKGAAVERSGSTV